VGYDTLIVAGSNYSLHSRPFLCDGINGGTVRHRHLSWF